MTVSTLDWKTAVTVASTGNVAGTFANPNNGPGDTLTASGVGALTVDGHTVVLNDRVLLKNQGAGLQNGIYCLTQPNVAGIIATTGAVVQPSSGTLKSGTYLGVALTGGTGSGAQATVVASGGVVTGVFVTNPGAGYTNGDVLTYNANGQGFGNGGTVTVASVANYGGPTGGILSLTGYTQPTGGTVTNGVYTGISLTGGTGTGAKATITVSGSTPLINLATAVTYAVLGDATVTNTGTSVLTGDLGLYPGTSVTGFPPGTFSGAENINNPASHQAQLDAQAAYTAGQALSGATVLSATSYDLGGTSPAPGLYSIGTSAAITGTVTLNAGGNPNAVWIFQIGSTLTTAGSSNVALMNGAQAKNVYWLVGSSATLGTSSTFNGTILAHVSITATTSAAVTGHLLAPFTTGAVSLDTNTVVATAAGSGAGSVTSIVVTTQGSGYVTSDVLGYTGVGLGTGGTATVGSVSASTGLILTTSTLTQPLTNFVTNGYYFGFPLTGGTGTGATANITIANGVVSVVLANPGSGYSPADILGFTGTGPNVGLGTGGTVAVSTVTFTPWVLERTPDANMAFQVAPMSVWVLGGSQINTAWVQDTLAVTMDSTALTFVQLVP